MTVARTAPNQTMLFEGTVSKFKPVIVTVEPTLPLVGSMQQMNGALACAAGCWMM